jgi:ectoine hydroxylase-related dioxygenase (phytanoyl-CoA dioxygenase family)
VGIQHDGHCVVRGLGTTAEIAAARPAINAAVARRRDRMPPIDERSTYDRAFIQAMNLWTVDESIREFVHNPRYARVAAELLGVPSVRLYHDQALFKEAGGGRTPWHQDQVYWPLDTGLPGGGTITMWMALHDIPAEVGSMTFADGSHLLGDLGGGVIADESDDTLGALLAGGRFTTTTHGAMDGGDATFHLGWTLHSAGPNPSSVAREVMTVIYYAADARVGAVDQPHRRVDHRTWLGSMPEGGPAAGPLNPVLWPPAG